MNIVDATVRPDVLMAKVDYVFNPCSKAWEIVYNAYWSEDQQRFIVWLGPQGTILHVYGRGARVRRQRYY